MQVAPSHAPKVGSSTNAKGDAHCGVEIIEGRNGTRRKNGVPARYRKGQFLGKGGFAKCYEVQDMDTKEIFAAKIVAKAGVIKPSAHAKLRSEISIHRSLEHDRVVQFVDYFEDSEHVYIILELCSNQTLNELMKKRPSKRLSEQEAMFYLHELIDSLKYLRGRRVIHRDLKLGNLLLDSANRLKVADFGLAAQLEHDGERKRTICGTPNYIAPEILKGEHGHSYEVDIWSLGVILYTMLVGRPPFETSDVKTTYRRIRHNQYSFPETCGLSDHAKNLVHTILKTDPKARPSLDEILASPWFQTSRLPPPMPVTICGYSASPRPGGASARSETPDRRGPDFARIDSPAPTARCPLTDRSPSVAQTPGAPQMAAQGLPRGHGMVPTPPIKNSTAAYANCGWTTPGRPPLAHRGNEENVVPGATAVAKDCGSNAGLHCSSGPAPSPTSSQLGLAATQPLQRSASTTSSGGPAHPNQLNQAPQSYTPQPTAQPGIPRATSYSHQPPPRRESSPMVGSGSLPTKVVAHGQCSARSASATSSPRQPLQSSARYGGNAVPNISTPRESRSARLVAQPSGGTDSGTGPLFTKTAPLVRAAQPVPSRRPNTASCDSPRPAMTGTQAAVTPSMDANSAKTPQTLQDKRPQSASAVQSARRNNCSSPALTEFEAGTPAVFAGGRDGLASHRMAPDSSRGFPSSRNTSPADMNFAALGASESLSSRQQNAVSPDARPEVWVTKWVDYSSKYGVGYALSDGSIGVYFNDSTKIILLPAGDFFDYITRRTQERPEVRTKHGMDNYPEDLKKKVTLLRHFKNQLLSDTPDKKDGTSVGSSSLLPLAQNNVHTGAASSSQAAASSQAHENQIGGEAPYMKKWLRNRHAIMFQLSNKIVQMIFFDKTEAVLCSKAHMVTYVDKRSQVCSYPLTNVLDVPNPELAKRLRYTKDILVNMMGARAGDLGGA